MGIQRKNACKGMTPKNFRSVNCSTRYEPEFLPWQKGKGKDREAGGNVSFENRLRFRKAANCPNQPQ
jgi:hypothetical protein